MLREADAFGARSAPGLGVITHTSESTMFTLPSPLHPLMVHVPIALTVLVPLFAIGALWVI